MPPSPYTASIPSKGKAPLSIPTQLAPSPRLPWEATGHICQAAAGPDALFCPQAVHGKAMVAPGGRALVAAEQCYLQSGQDLLVGRESPVRKT